MLSLGGREGRKKWAGLASSRCRMSRGPLVWRVQDFSSSPRTMTFSQRSEVASPEGSSTLMEMECEELLMSIQNPASPTSFGG